MARLLEAAAGGAVFLDVLAENTHAVALYRRLGFVDDGWARDEGDPRPALRMRWQVPSGR